MANESAASQALDGDTDTGAPGAGAETPAEAAARAYRRVIDARGQTIGYVAPTLGVDGAWSVYDSGRCRIAMVAPEDDRQRIVLTGPETSDAIEYMVAKTFRGALALVFGLEALPALDPPLE